MDDDKDGRLSLDEFLIAVRQRLRSRAQREAEAHAAGGWAVLVAAAAADPLAWAERLGDLVERLDRSGRPEQGGGRGVLAATDFAQGLSSDCGANLTPAQVDRIALDLCAAMGVRPGGDGGRGGDGGGDGDGGDGGDGGGGGEVSFDVFLEAFDRAGRGLQPVPVAHHPRSAVAFTDDDGDFGYDGSSGRRGGGGKGSGKGGRGKSGDKGGKGNNVRQPKLRLGLVAGVRAENEAASSAAAWHRLVKLVLADPGAWERGCAVLFETHGRYHQASAPLPGGVGAAGGGVDGEVVVRVRELLEGLSWLGLRLSRPQALAFAADLVKEGLDGNVSAVALH